MSNTTTGLIATNDPAFRAMAARKLARLHPAAQITETVSTPCEGFTTGETAISDTTAPAEKAANTPASLVPQGLSHFPETSDTENVSDSKAVKQQRYRELKAEMNQLERELADPAAAAERARLLQLVPEYWSRFLAAPVSPATGNPRYQFMFPQELIDANWKAMRKLSVPNQWDYVEPHVQGNPALASYIDSIGLRAFQTLLTGYSLGLIVHRLQRLLSGHLRSTSQPARTVIAQNSDTNTVIQSLQAEVRELKLRAQKPLSYQSAVQACADWVNDADAELRKLDATTSDTKPSSDTKRRGRQHDAARDALVMDLIIREGKNQSEVARHLSVNEKVIRRIVQRYRDQQAA